MDLETVSALLQHPGPYLTVYVDVTRDTADAEHRIELAWRSARERVSRDGAPDGLTDLVEGHVLRPTSAPGRVNRMVVAAHGDVLLDEEVRQTDPADVVTWGPLPDVTSWLSDRDMMIPVLLVIADREGADIEYYDGWPGYPTDEDSIHGETLHIKKVPAGGWAHKQYQRRTEEVWRRNADEVATEIDHRARGGVPLIALTGDVRAVGEIREALSEPAASKVVVLEDGSRAEGSSREMLDDAVDQAVRDTVIEEHLHSVREIEEGTGQRGDAVHGLPEVIENLVQGRVRTLALALRIAAQREVAPAEYPGLPLPEQALEHARLRADLVAVCAAAATDADLVILGAASLPQDGIAALLRWS